MPLWIAVSLAAAPMPDLAAQTACAGRPACTASSHHEAGADPEGHALHVVEVSLGEMSDAEMEAAGAVRNCERTEWHLVRLRDGELVDHRQLLELCNDGYGASGVGDDRVEVEPNRFVHEQMGGSSWRWSQGRAEQLSPPLLLETWRGSWISPMGNESQERWSWTTRSGWFTAELVACDAQGQTDPERQPVKGVVLPILPVADVMGRCAAEVHAGDERGLVLHGPRSSADDGRMRVALHGERSLVVSVTDDTWVDKPAKADGSWILADHLEVWLPEGRSPGSGQCTEPWAAKQWGVMLDGTVHPALGQPDPKALTADVRQVGATRRFTLTLPEDTRRLAVVYSDSDDGQTQERLIGTSTVRAGDAHTLLTPRKVDDARCAVEAPE